MNGKTFFRDILLHLAIRLGILAGIAAACALYMFWVEKYNPPYVEPGGYDDTLLGVVFNFIFAMIAWMVWLAVEAPRLMKKGRRMSAMTNCAIIFVLVVLLLVVVIRLVI
jgi:hypothetical protein